MNDILRMVTKQEELLRFDSFSNDDAFALGCLLVKHGKKFGPAAVEVSINGLALFRNFPNGTNQENGVWLAAKRNLVNARGRSSYGSFLEAQKQGKNVYTDLTQWENYAKVLSRNCKITGCFTFPIASYNEIKNKKVDLLMSP